jgi:hypothetical protein
MGVTMGLLANGIDIAPQCDKKAQILHFPWPESPHGDSPKKVFS